MTEPQDLQPPPPVLVMELFPEERALLLDLLSGLSDAAWRVPTACPGWSVKDIAGHLLGDDLGRLSAQRDGYRLPFLPGEDLLAFINRRNDEWVTALRRLSPHLLCELLRFSGEAIMELFCSLDPFALGGAVSWAGPEPAPVWLDLAREYTERWHHQQHIREAVGHPSLTAPRYLAPVLATFVRAMPWTLRDIAAPRGATVVLTITGDSGGAWTARRDAAGWTLLAGTAVQPTARVSLDQETAWRRFTNGLTPNEAARLSQIEGDEALARPLLHMVSIIA